MGMVLSVIRDEIKPVEDKIIVELKSNKFKIKRHYKGLNYKIRLLKNKFSFEICGYSTDPGSDVFYRQLKNKRKVIPAKFILPPYSSIKLYNYEFMAPGDILGLLKFLYVDPSYIFKSPGKSPSKYKTKKHMVIKK